MKISRPLVLIDLETTGIWVEKDKIIEIGMIKCWPDGSREKYLKRVQPGIPIPPVVTELTGISDSDVASAPLFKDLAAEIHAFISDSDLGGFNVKRFDLPLLQRELFDAQITFEWESRTIFDSQEIYHIKEKRDLTAAYNYYCHKELLGAHSALADIEATLEVLEKQVEKYGSADGSLDALQDIGYERRGDFYDSEHKFAWWNNELYMTFGKYARKKSLKDIAFSDPGYLSWILKADFSEAVKGLVKKALAGELPKRNTLLV
jgi:DNA polymerase-3 subunit epsilon